MQDLCQSSHKYDSQHNHQNQQQATSLASRALLMPTCSPQLLIRIPSVVARLRHVVRNDIKRLALLVNHMRHISEQLVQLANRLLNVANLRLPLNNQSLLEVNLRLLSKARLLLLQLLLLLLLLATSALRRRSLALLVQRTPGRGRTRALLLDRVPLQHLELGQAGAELLVELALRVLLARAQVFPVGDALQPFADFLEAVACFL